MQEGQGKAIFLLVFSRLEVKVMQYDQNKGQYMMNINLWMCLPDPSWGFMQYLGKMHPYAPLKNQC